MGQVRRAWDYARDHPGMWMWALGAAGFAVGYALFALAPGHNVACRYPLDNTSRCFVFSDTPQFHIWTALVGAQTALWAVLAVGFRWAAAELAARVPREDRRQTLVAYLAFSAFVLVAGGLILLLLKPPPPVGAFKIRVGILTVLGLITVAPAATGMWLIVLELRAIRDRLAHDDPADRVPTGPDVATVVASRRTLKLLVSYVGAVIGSIALSTGALQKAVTTWHDMSRTPVNPVKAGGPEFPPEFVLLYAIFFIVLLTLVYAPVYLDLERTGRQILDRVFPMDARILRPEWEAGRTSLANLMELGIRLEESLRAGLAILAPLGGLLLSSFLPGSK